MISVTASVMLAPSAGFACTKPLQGCANPLGGHTTRYGGDDNVFIILDTDGDKEQLAMVFCPSRHALVVPRSGYAKDKTWGADFSLTLSILTEAHMSPKSFGLRDVQEQIKTAGGRAQITTLPKEHCVCGQEILQPVSSDCPEDEGIPLEQIQQQEGATR